MGEELSRVEDLLATGVEEPVEPMSRVEAILRGEDIKPLSRVEDLLKGYNPPDYEYIDLNVTENGTYTPPSGKMYKKAVVDVPSQEPVLGGISIYSNGTYTPDPGVDGFDNVLVAVPATQLDNLSVTENGTYTPISGHGFNEVTVDVAGSGGLKTIEHVNTATFADGTDNFLKSLEVAIEPQQDLHGYYYPWAGGSGKNLFNMGSKWSGSDSGLSFTTDDDYVTMNGVKSGANYVTPSQLYFDLPAGTYYAKAFVISGTASNKPSIYVYSNQELTSNMLNTGRSFTLESQTSVGIRFTFWNDGATYSNYKIGIVIGKDADIDKFYPYSNICPFSGWSAANVNVSGVNVWDEETKSGYYDVLTGSYVRHANQLCCKDYISVRPNMTLYGYKGSYTSYGELLFYDCNHDYISYLRPTQWINKKFTIPINCYYITFNLGSAYGATYNNDISINYPSTDTEYHAYNGHTTTIQLGDTYYGGKLDVVSGELKVVPYYASYNGETLEGEWISDRDVYAVGTTPTIGAQVVNIGATPQTYQLTPTIIKSLQGDNNLFADSGEIELLQYWSTDADPILSDLNVDSNGEYTPAAGHGFRKVTVDVAGVGGLEEVDLYLDEYEELTPQQKSDTTKIYFVTDEEE